MSKSYSHTTPTGLCPLPGADHCPNFCEALQICATVERGECLFPNGLDGDDFPSFDNSVLRNVFTITLHIKNCLDSELRLTQVVLNLHERLLQVDETGVESAVNVSAPPGSVVDPAAGVPEFKLINFTTTCGNLNNNTDPEVDDGYNGNIENNDASRANLFIGRTVLPPGECCVKLVFGVDVLNNDMDNNSFNDILLESACVRVRGIVPTSNACCKFQRDLMLPASCPLRQDRETILPPFSP